jgi:hypothetical protein
VHGMNTYGSVVIVTTDLYFATTCELEHYLCNVLGLLRVKDHITLYLVTWMVEWTRLNEIDSQGHQVVQSINIDQTI